MSGIAIALILASALTHAGWNLISKQSSPSALFFLAANSIGAWIFLPWVLLYPGILPAIPGGVWALLALTGLFQALYCISLAASYRHGDLSVSYPIARALPVILVPAATVLLGRGELLGARFLNGAFLILAGCAMVSAREILPCRGRFLKNAVAMAALAAVGTAGYSMVDDLALRILRNGPAGSHGTIPATLVYAFLEALACALWIGIFLLLTPGYRTGPRTEVRRAAVTGVLMYITYGMVLLSLAYSRDVSLVVVFRQVSIVAGALMGFAFLREPARPVKIAGLALLLAGLLLVATS